MPLADIEAAIARLRDAPGDAAAAAAELLSLGEQVLEHWVSAHGFEPTTQVREGFRILALHRQGTTGDPSFNACRETCRELVYHYNLIRESGDPDEARNLARLAAMVTHHLYLFVAGKLETAALGDFCCSSRPFHARET